MLNSFLSLDQLASKLQFNFMPACLVLFQWMFNLMCKRKGKTLALIYGAIWILVDLQMNPFSCRFLGLCQSVFTFIPLLSALTAPIHPLHLLHTCLLSFQALHRHIHPHYSMLLRLITVSETKPVSPDSFKRLPWFFLTDPLEEPCAIIPNR